jgi:hypothetical protein
MIEDISSLTLLLFVQKLNLKTKLDHPALDTYLSNSEISHRSYGVSHPVFCTRFLFINSSLYGRGAKYL